MIWLWVVLSLVIGATLGIFVSAVMTVSKVSELKTEIERLQKENNLMWGNAVHNADLTYMQVQHTVKEYAERLKALFPSDNELYRYWEIHEGADLILREMGIDQ